MASILETRTVHWSDEVACAVSAQALAVHPDLRDAYVELHGPLGAGKTTFVRHLLLALGVEGRVKSPTYAVMEPYRILAPRVARVATAGTDDRPLDIWHFDFYRFDDPQEFEDAGFRELFASPGLKLAEWPENAAGLVPAPDLRIDIEPVGDESRRVTFRACSAAGARLLA